MDQQEFADRTEAIKTRLYRTAYLYLGSEADALEAVDETVYRALRRLKQLQTPAFFETWITRILINTCQDELRRRRRFHPGGADALPDTAGPDDYEHLPLREAIRRLPEELRSVGDPAVFLRVHPGGDRRRAEHSAGDCGHPSETGAGPAEIGAGRGGTGMNRMDEYTALLAELEQTPEELDNTVNKALNRKNALQKKRRFLGTSLGGLAACFATFVLLVNLSTPFARACGRIPLLADLAKAVSWSPSLSAAVENDYVQPLRLSQSQNGITARVEYLIVDRKQVDVFFSIRSDDYAHLDLEHPKLTVPGEQEGYASSFSSYGIENGDLMELRIDFMNRDVPDSLTMTFGVYDNKHLYENQKPPAQSSVADYGVELLSDNPKEQRKILATFTFELRFDPTYTEQGTVIDVGETFLLDGQSVTLTEAEIYPTHLRLNFDYDPANTAWLTELNFYLENERGEMFNGIVNGISATGNPDDPSTDSVWLDSPYFSTGEHLTLHVTGASWIDKGQERVKVDLVKGMIEDPPQGVRLEWAEKRNAGWVVSFSAGARWEKTMHYQIWKNRFYDEDGTAHDINQRGSSNSPMILGEISGAELEAYEAAEKAAKEEGRYFETFGLKDCAADCVWLEPCWTRITDSTAQVVIK